MLYELSKKPETVRRILPDIDPDQLKIDLEKLKNIAIDMGAAQAVIIEKKDIIFTFDVLQRISADNGFASIHWPLFYPKDDIQEAISAYGWGIFFRMNVDGNFSDYGGGPISNETHRQIYLRVYEITTAIESAGFYMGYHLSLGLAAGNCRAVFCADEKRCWPMIKGKVCVRPNMGRPSMEAAGIDATAMAENLGMQTDGKLQSPILTGLVMIA